MNGNSDQLGLHLSDYPAIRPSLPVLDSRLRGTKFVSLTPKSILNSPQQTGVDFWSLNPYVGCEFGCTYCYARYAHRYVVERAHDAGKLDDAEFRDFRGPYGWEAFEKRVFVKEGILAALDRDLQRFFRTAIRPYGDTANTIVIGTATDPYQPAERTYKLTRAVLERLARYEGLSVGIITKSPLVARDADILRRLAEHNDIEILISLITVDVELIRAFEVRSPRPVGTWKRSSGRPGRRGPGSSTRARCACIPPCATGSCRCWRRGRRRSLSGTALRTRSRGRRREPIPVR